MKKSLLKLFLCLVGIVVTTLWTIDWAIAQTFPHPNSLIAQTSITSPAREEQQPPEPTVPATPNFPETEEQPVENPGRQPSDRQSSSAPSASPSNSSQPQSGGPYDTKAIEEFYKSLYGS